MSYPDRSPWGDSKFRGMHEEVLVLKWMSRLTWQKLVLRTLKELGSEAELKELYETIAKHPKHLSNPTYQATVRRTLQEAAAHEGKGLWKWMGEK